MIKVYFSQQLESLAEKLADSLQHPDPASLLRPHYIVVPDRKIAHYFEFFFAQRFSISANFVMLRWPSMISLLAKPAQVRFLNRESLEIVLLNTLFAKGALAETFPELAFYAQADGDEASQHRKRLRLAEHLARIYDAYLLHRPEMLASWVGEKPMRGQSDLELWQANLWRHIHADVQRFVRTTEKAWIDWSDLAGFDRKLSSANEVHFFGFSTLPKAWLLSLAQLAKTKEVAVYAFNPCQEYWEDLGQVSPLEVADGEPQTVTSFLRENDNLPLALWGKGGRGFVQVLCAMTEGDVSFLEPRYLAAAGVLPELQRTILERRPIPEPAPSANAPFEESHEGGDLFEDTTFRVFSASNVTAELEEVACDIWKQLCGQPSLSFRDIAVLVASNDLDRYILKLEAIFREARGLPMTALEPHATSHESWLEGARKLLLLPLSERFGRSWSEFLSHPVFVEAALFEPANLQFLAELESCGWSAWLSEDAPSQADAEDSGSTVAPSFFSAANCRVSLVLQSLKHDLEFTLGTRAPLQWLDYIESLLLVYLRPRNRSDDEQQRQVLRLISDLRDQPWQELGLPYEVVASLLARRLGEMRQQNSFLRHNAISVASLRAQPLLPYRLIYVVGLNQSDFPIHDSLSSLDLRAERPQALDIFSDERDRYAFLQCLCAARQRLVLSYPMRESAKGASLEPSLLLSQAVLIAKNLTLGAREEAKPRAAKPSQDSDLRSAVLPITSEEEQLYARVSSASGTRLLSASSINQPRSLLLEKLRLRKDCGFVEWSAIRSQPSVPSPPSLVRLNLDLLKRFLDDPALTWLEWKIGMRSLRQYDEANIAPLAVPLHQRTRLLAKALSDAGHYHVAPEVLYKWHVGRLKLRESWPNDFMGVATSDHDLEVLRKWHGEEKEAVFLRLHLERLPHSPPSTAYAPPLHLVLAGNQTTVELVGALDFLDHAFRRSAMFLSRRSRVGMDRVRQRQRFMLRSYVDHMVLSALEKPTPGDRTVEFLTYTEPDVIEHGTFAELTAPQAISTLNNLLKDFVGGFHDYFFPSEVAMAFQYQGAYGRSASLTEILRSTYEKWLSHTWYDQSLLRWLRLPNQEEAHDIFQRRFAPFFSATKDESYD